jgi:predicted DNA-binding protein with PD1-like motif
MKQLVLDEHDGLRTFALVLATGDEVMSELAAFAKDHRLEASHFTALGACSDAVVAYFDWKTKQYQKIPIPEQTEILSLVGDVTIGDDGPKVHAHVVLGKSDATAHGGHLIAAHVRPTLEIVLTETPHRLRRRFDAASGLALIDPSASS